MTLCAKFTAYIVLVLYVAGLVRSNNDDTEFSIHVDSSRVIGDGVPRDGTLKRPYASLDEAKDHIVRSHALKKPQNVFIHSGVYRSLHIDHPALSGVAWRGVDGEPLPLISGGVVVPLERFQPAKNLPKGVFVASLDGLNVPDLGNMISGNPVSDCQHDKVGLSYGGELMTLARWPNVKRDENVTWQWTHATVDAHKTPTNKFTMDTTKDPDAKRILNWASEKNPYLHGYFEWDWGDAYGAITDISEIGKFVHIQYRDAPNCKPNARWMGVNLLCELDQPGEYYLDTQENLVYFYPPAPFSKNISSTDDDYLPVTLMYQRGAVVNVSASVSNVRLSNVEIANGRHAGISAVGARGLTIENVLVHAHGTHGIILTNARDSVIRNSEVFDVGCIGIKTTGGIAKTLEPGLLNIVGNRVHHFARWKRSYQPGIYWGGVNNTYRENSVYYSPHNCFLGGGNFEDGVNNLFEGNILSDCTFETLDAGAFYSCGQMGNAFTNRGNVLHGNTFNRIHKMAGSGVQDASNQAVYLDDQMSAWTITDNTFVDCHVASFIGGGRHNVVKRNRFVSCGTVQYINDQGRTFDSETVNCTDISPPGRTTCSTGAAKWMVTKAPAAAEWMASWPQMDTIYSDPNLGYPAGTLVAENTYCNCTEFFSSNGVDLKLWNITAVNNKEDHQCYK